MMSTHTSEVVAYWERAEQSLEAARDLAAGGYYDIAASRAYYAAFYAATAVLLCEGRFMCLSPRRRKPFVLRLISWMLLNHYCGRHQVGHSDM